VTGFETDECLPVPGPAIGIPLLAQRLKAMYQEMPGMRLSVADAARLAGLDPSVCRAILEALADVHFLKRGHDGTFSLE
jgi:DNA-binding IclR family transcriptional regulator